MRPAPVLLWLGALAVALAPISAAAAAAAAAGALAAGARLARVARRLALLAEASYPDAVRALNA